MDPMEELKRGQEMSRLRQDIGLLKIQMQTVRVYIRGKEAPGSSIPTWGRRPEYHDSAQDGGGAAYGACEFQCDEIFLHDRVPDPGPGLLRELQHFPIEQQPAPDRGDDIVRKATGHHITHTVGQDMVNTGGHIDVSKTGAGVSHAEPDQDENEQEVGITSVTNTTADPETALVNGTQGLALTELARIAWADETGVRNLYAFFRTWLSDYNGHVTRVAGEAKSAAIPILSPDGVNLTLSTGTLTHIVGPHVYGHETNQTGLHGISLDARGHVRKVYAYGAWIGPSA